MSFRPITNAVVPLVLSCAGVRVGAQCAPEWRPMGEGLDAEILALTVYDDAVIAAGRFATRNRIARWDGSAWLTLGGGISGPSVAALTVYDGALIAGGLFTSAGGVPAQNIAAWDGAAWSALDSGTSGHVAALIVHEGALVAGGSFLAAGGVSVSKIARWDGKSWEPLGVIPGKYFGAGAAPVTQFVVHNGDLVAATGVWHAAGVRGTVIARWQSPDWVVIALLGWPGSVLPVGGGFTLASHNGDLVASGFPSAGTWPKYTPEFHLKRWVGGTSWADLGVSMNSQVQVLAGYEGALVAGGYFTSVNGLEAICIARGEGTSWAPLGRGVAGAVNAVVADGGSLVVGGSFLTAGGQPSPHVARWGCPCYADCDASGSLTIADFGCFQTMFANGHAYADCNGAGGHTVADFGCFQTKFASGCR